MANENIQVTQELTELPEAKSLEAHQKAERAYYKGETKKVPGSDLSVAELRKKYLESVAADAQAKVDKFEKQYKAQRERLSERYGGVLLPNNTFTSATTFQTMAEVKSELLGASLTPADIDADFRLPEIQSMLAAQKAEVATEKEIKEAVKAELKYQVPKTDAPKPENSLK